MKRILLLIALLTGVLQLKAQNKFQFKPMDSLSLKKYFNKPADTLAKLWSPLLKSNGFNFTPSAPGNLAMLSVSHSPVDHMPIARFPGNSKMPIYKFPGNSRMPVIDPITKERLDLRTPEAIVQDSK